MKKYCKYLFIVLATFMLSGCYKITTNMTVNSDKSMDFEMIYAFDMKTMEGLGGTTSDDDNLDNSENDLEDEIISEEEMKETFGKKGFDVKAYSNTEENHEWKGVIITKKYNNIDDISKSEEKVVVMTDGTSNDEFVFDDSQLFSLNSGIYKANFLYNFTSGEDDTTDYSAYSSMLDLKYTVTLPGKVISNNATTVSSDGKTLTWNLEIGKKNEINYEFSLNENTTNTALIIGVALGAVVLIVVAIIFVVKKSNKHTNV